MSFLVEKTHKQLKYNRINILIGDICKLLSQHRGKATNFLWNAKRRKVIESLHGESDIWS